jgi:imidazolonepropionase-like amidohydrolase
MPGSSDAAVADASAPSCTHCTVVRHVRVVDADGVRMDRSVAIEGASILFDVDDAGSIAGTAMEIDGTNKTLLPGLWDMHVHLQASGTPRGEPIALDLPAHLMGYLISGVTSIFDMGSDRNSILSLRDRIRAGGLLAPHLFSVGPLFTAPGGHPCIRDYSADFCSLVTDDGSAETLVAALEPLHPDLVKLVIEGGIAPLNPIPRVTSDEVRAVSDAAHRHNLRVISHVSRTQDAIDAVSGRVDALAHIPVEVPLADDVLDAIARAKIPVVSTIVVYDAFGHFIDDPGYLDDPLVAATVEPDAIAADRDPSVRASYGTPSGQTFITDFRSYAANAAENLRRLKAKGVPILAGSDAGNFYVFHGPGLHRELQLMVKAGLSPVEAIAAATRAPAMFAGAMNSGLVQAGYAADLLLVDGDASSDIMALEAIDRVFLGGEAIDRSALGPKADVHTIVRTPAMGGAGASCVEDADCLDSGRCDPFTSLCAKSCTLSDPTSCGTTSGCLEIDTTSPVCYASSGCHPLQQDCAFSDVYHFTCTPVSASYTYCVAPGPQTLGQACSFTSGCAEGLYCGLDNACHQLCDPKGTALPPCASGKLCQDLSASWGQPVGLCTN